MHSHSTGQSSRINEEEEESEDQDDRDYKLDDSEYDISDGDDDLDADIPNVDDKEYLKLKKLVKRKWALKDTLRKRTCGVLNQMMRQVDSNSRHSERRT
jgi:hypothetical protein